MIVIGKEINTTPPRKLWYDWKAKYSKGLCPRKSSHDEEIRNGTILL